MHRPISARCCASSRQVDFHSPNTVLNLHIDWFDSCRTRLTCARLSTERQTYRLKDSFSLCGAGLNKYFTLNVVLNSCGWLIDFAYLQCYSLSHAGRQHRSPRQWTVSAIEELCLQFCRENRLDDYWTLATCSLVIRFRLVSLHLSFRV